MIRTPSHTLRRSLAMVPAVALAAACADHAPLAPESHIAPARQIAALPAPAATNSVVATLRSATARYHDLDAAIADGFVFLHECENRPGEGPVGIVYIHMDRLLDGAIDPALPDGLVYEPSATGNPKLVAAELAVPYALWPGNEPPVFQGATFQREDEFGVFGLHVWVWRHNPEGLFGESNPRVSCEPS